MEPIMILQDAIRAYLEIKNLVIDVLRPRSSRLLSRLGTMEGLTLGVQISH